MIRLMLFLSFLLCLAAPSPLFAWDGRVTSVIDGDLLTALHDGREERLRLFGVDTPDEPQEFGREAREFTSESVLEKVVQVVPVSRDRHGNTVAIVLVGGVTLNRELAASGLAWVYTRDCDRPECKEWKKDETEARKRRDGLWSSPNKPIAPWDFRRSGGNSSKIVQDVRTSRSEGKQERPVYCGDILTHIYYSPGCPEHKGKTCIADFKTRREAERAGYKPGPKCFPPEP
jgi:micrococcal nuclease